MLQKAQRLCEQPIVACRMSDEASLGGRNSGCS
jgi:hypothetical protein